MTAPLHPTPRPRDVLREQIRVAGLALRLPALAVGVLVLIGTLFVVLDVLRAGRSVDFDPASQMLPGVAGALLPIALWSGEDRFGHGFFRTLPVEHRRHVLSRVVAGWLCLITAVAVFVLWQFAIALVTGGNVLAPEWIRLLPSSTPPSPAQLEPDALHAVRRAVQPALWLAPFTGATGAYLLSSAVALGVRRPLRWIAGVVLVFVLGGNLLSELLLAADARTLALAPSRWFDALLFGPYGLDALLTGRTESLRTEVRLASGEWQTAWRGLPTVREWAVATCLWIGAGLLALWGASLRHRERRRK